jgi:hypothetical protein
VLWACGIGAVQPRGCGGGPAQLVVSQGIGSLCKGGEGVGGFSRPREEVNLLNGMPWGDLNPSGQGILFFY